MTPLTESQKYTLLCLLKDLASADRDFNFQEATRIRLVGLKLDLHPEKISEALSEDFEPITKHLEKFDDPIQQRFVYQQCISLLMADHEMSDAEKKEAATIRQTFQLEDAFHEKVMRWVQEGLEWENRGAALVEEIE